MASSGLGLGGSDIWGDSEGVALEAELADLSTEQIRRRTEMQEGNARHNRATMSRLQREIGERKAEVKDNHEKIMTNKVLPYLVANVVEVRGIAARPPVVPLRGSLRSSPARAILNHSMPPCYTKHHFVDS